jgi:hypothetical protein
MRRLHIGDQIIRYDTERTRTAYAAIKSGSALRCGCPYCRNFVAQRSTVYPEEFRQLLDQLGVDPKKEGDVFEESPYSSLVRYGGWFYLTGELIEAGERMADAGLDSSRIVPTMALPTTTKKSSSQECVDRDQSN